MDKDYYRNSVKEQRKLNPDKNIKDGNSVIEKYLSLDCYKKADIILVYNSMPEEINTEKIVKSAFKDGKTVALPKIFSKVKDGGVMEFIKITPFTKYEIKNGILEPASGDILEPENCSDNIEMLLPGLCFDKRGNRLGYGGGYYDRYLSRFLKKQFHKTAATLSYQIFDSLPVDNGDIPVDMIITEKEVLIISSYLQTKFE